MQCRGHVTGDELGGKQSAQIVMLRYHTLTRQMIHPARDEMPQNTSRGTHLINDHDEDGSTK